MASPQLETVIQLVRFLRREGEGLSLPEGRARTEERAALAPIPPDVKSEPADANGVPGQWITTDASQEDRVLYYLHGGGYTFCSVSTHREMIARVSRAAQARAFAINYRLAPEHPFPAAVEDAVTAYRWLLAQGLDPRRLVIGGDSAGGGLTIATMLALRDAGDPLPAAAVCISPWTDMEGSGQSMISRAEVDPMVQRDLLLLAAKAYLGDADPRNPLASPIYADLRGLPPLLIHVGTAETLLDDSTRLAEKAKADGVDVTLEPWDDMIHVWHAFAILLPEGQQAIDRIGEFIRQQVD